MAWSKGYSSNYALIDWSDFKPSLPARVEQPKGNSGPYLMGDIAPFISPLNGREITSRSQLRAHERAFGVRQVGTDLKPQDYAARPELRSNDRALESAYRIALQKAGLS